MTRDINDPIVRLEVQGDRVLVHQTSTDKTYVLTIVHVIDFDKHELRLVNRDKTGKPDWPLSQRLFDALRPAPENKDQAKWLLNIK